MKLTHTLGAVAAAALLAAVPAAHAVPTLSFSYNGGAAVTCADGAACDGNALAGVVQFSGSIGAFIVNVTTGITKPILGYPHLMDLNSVNVQSAGFGTNTLDMMFSDDGFSGPMTVNSLFGGTIGNGTITANAYYGATLFSTANSLGTLGPFSAGAFSGSTNGLANAPSFALTQHLTLTLTGNSTFSGDYALDVPEPGSLALAGLALLGLGASMRRRAK